MKALLIWELGGGQGHLQCHSATAHFLTEQGIKSILSLIDRVFTAIESM